MYSVGVVRSALLVQFQTCFLPMNQSRAVTRHHLLPVPPFPALQGHHVLFLPALSRSFSI